MVEELGLKGWKEKVTINVANHQKVDLMSVCHCGNWIGEFGWSSRHYYCSKGIKQYLWRHETYRLAANKRSMEAFKGHSLPKNVERAVKFMPSLAQITTICYFPRRKSAEVTVTLVPDFVH